MVNQQDDDNVVLEVEKWNPMEDTSHSNSFAIIFRQFLSYVCPRLQILADTNISEFSE